MVRAQAAWMMCGMMLGLAALVRASELPVSWERELFDVSPRVWEASERVGKGLRTVFYENVPYQQRETRVFACLGVPESKDGRPVPGMVLVHGGEGSDLVRWVRLWNERGYAALAMDWNGCVRGKDGPSRHAWSGPQGPDPWREADIPVADQWAYHAVAAVIRANSLLRSVPGVDSDRIGLTGIEWGGFLSCIVSGVDPRFRFVAPVYGCGFLVEHSQWKDVERFDVFGGCSADKLMRYDATWDPKNYLPAATMPFLFIDGTNDRAYPLDILERSRSLVKTEVTRCTIPRLEHGHGPASECPPELFAFADGLFGKDPGLPRCTRLDVDAGVFAGPSSAAFELKGDEIAEATLEYTTTPGETRQRDWLSLAASVSNDVVSADVPKRTTGFFFRIRTKRGLHVSSDARLRGPFLPREIYDSTPEARRAIRSILDLELEPPVVVSNPDPDEYAFAKLDFAVNGGMTQTAKGRLFLTWGAGEDGNRSYMIGTWSDDDGKTFADTRFLVGSKFPIGHIGMSNLHLSVLISNLWFAPDGTLRLYVYQAVNQFNGRGTLWEFICENPDAAEPVWGQARRIGWGELHQNPIVLSDGTWLLPTDFERCIPDGAVDLFPELDSQRGCGVTISKDGGRTWTWKGRARPVESSHFCEHGVVELADHSLFMYMRTGKGLRESRSTDGGATWSVPKPPVGLNQVISRFGFIKLANGHWLFVKNGEAADKINGNVREKLSAYVSDDEGRTWKGCLMLDERDRVAYPYVIQAADGSIYLSYDHDRTTESDEVLLSRFTEDEVLAGKLVNPNSFLKRVVFRERAKKAHE